MMRDGMREILYKIFALFSSNKTIVFESVPDFSDNTKAVFDEMLRRGMDKKYRLVWFVSDKKKRLPENKSVKYICTDNRLEQIRCAYYLATAKCLICCNRFLEPHSKKQVAFYLAHGTPIKRVKDYYTMPKSIDYCLSASLGVEKMTADQFNADEKKMFSLGYPRNDVFLKPKICVKELLKTDCKKVIVWYPTFRQHKCGLKTGTERAFPVIHDVEIAGKLNDFARLHNVLIVLKPHFAQDLQGFKEQNLDHIRFINDDFFTENRISSYEFVAGCDALITDYSSIYFDYTLCDKPMAVVWEDVEEYRTNPGFAVDLDYYLKGAVKIYNLEEFQQFVLEVSRGVDSLVTERREIRDFVNYAADSDNSKRVVDFMIEKAGL